MRNWKNWLAPILTALAVACLSVLPLRLSQARDEALIGAVHVEELGESSFPARPPELAERIRLLVWQDALPETITIVEQALLDGQVPEQGREQVQAELERLAEEKILPDISNMPLDSDSVYSAERIYLRDQRDLSSAAFLRLDTYGKIKRESLSVVLDHETGRILALQAVSAALWVEDWDLVDLGKRFLDDLGVAYEAETVEVSNTEALFRLPGRPILYQFLRVKDYLWIGPQVDWEAVDKEASYAVSYDAG